MAAPLEHSRKRNNVLSCTSGAVKMRNVSKCVGKWRFCKVLHVCRCSTFISRIGRSEMAWVLYLMSSWSSGTQSSDTGVDCRSWTHWDGKCSVMVNEILQVLNVAHGDISAMMRSSWTKCRQDGVPRQLATDLKERLGEACQELLRFFEAESAVFLARILLAKNRRFTNVSRKARKQARNGTIPRHQNQRSYRQLAG